MPKLKWSEQQNPNDSCGYDHVFFKCPVLGKIYIDWKGWKEFGSYDCIIMNNDFETIIEAHENNLEDAKNEVAKQYAIIADKMKLEIT